jgi:hypothetical protein
MGAGKTTVVGPLLALLASSNNDRLVTLCCPAPLLEFSRGYVVVHVCLAVECTNTAFLCLSCHLSFRLSFSACLSLPVFLCLSFSACLATFLSAFLSAFFFFLLPPTQHVARKVQCCDTKIHLHVSFQSKCPCHQPDARQIDSSTRLRVHFGDFPRSIESNFVVLRVHSARHW